MNIGRLMIRFAVAFTGMGVLAAGPPPSSEPRIEVVRVTNEIVVLQRIAAGDSQLVVPTCGAVGDQELSLCFLALDIEVESRGGWVRAPLNRDIGSVPGGYPIDQRPVKLIAPGTAAEFTFTIDKQDYVFKRGQQIRLRIHTWPTEESMRAHGPKQELITPPFQAW
jgi:hypothetical protein